MLTTVEIRHFHLFAGLGGGARGFNRGAARVGSLQAMFRCIGGIDVDAPAMRDFERLAGVPGTVLDLFDREQYRAFVGAEPPADWREATPADIQRAAGGERPHIVFLSAPCKGFSGLLSEAKSLTAKYQALNRLTLRGVWLMLEAWADDPPELVLFENVPRLATRGRALLDRITAMLRAYGYATAETTHDCGELGGLAQSRKRFLLVARHLEKVPPLLYEPDRRPLRAVGDVLARLPLPGAAAGVPMHRVPMHRVPSLAWKTWVRLAFVEAGSDWRSLNRLAVEDGVLRDYLLVPEMHRGGYGVRRWDEPCGVVAGESLPSNGNFSVADPRVDQSAAWNHGQHYGVHGWQDTAGAVSGQCWPNQGRYAVADPRVEPTDFKGYRVVDWRSKAGTVTGARAPGSSAQAVADPRHAGPAKHSNEFRIARWDRASGAVTSAHGTGQCVADPRPGWDRHGNNLRVNAWDAPSPTIIAGGKGVQGGWLSIADPRAGLAADRAAYLTGGHYGVVPWTEPSGAVSAAACHDNGRWSVADPRPLPAADEKLLARIVSLDGTWHRPFTTLELAALQSLFDPEDPVDVAAFGLDGESDSAWRERIGNAVPSDAAASIAGEMGRTLLLAWSGETFALSMAPVWVRPVVAGLSVAQGGTA
jgi:site-specific DNA-cytosine methylase